MIKKSKKSSDSSSKKSRASAGTGFGGVTPSSGAAAAGPELEGGPAWASRFPFAGSVRPGSQSSQKVIIADNVLPPDYAEDGSPKNAKPMLPWVVEVKTPEQIEKMRASGSLARHVLDTGGRAIKPGVTTNEIDEIVHQEALKVRLFTRCLYYFILQLFSWSALSHLFLLLLHCFRWSICFFELSSIDRII
jgi:hypothetical protein